MEAFIWILAFLGMVGVLVLSAAQVVWLVSREEHPVPIWLIIVSSLILLGSILCGFAAMIVAAASEWDAYTTSLLFLGFALNAGMLAFIIPWGGPEKAKVSDA